MKLSAARVLQTYGELVENRPILTQVVTAGLLLTLGDVIAQLVFERKKKYDWHRTAVMAIIGFTLSGPFVTLWLIVLSNWGLSVVANVALDQLFFSPILLLGFLTIHSLLHGRGWKTARYRVRYELLDVVKANWMFWVPAQIFNFKFVPFNYRMLFIQSLALFWNCYLSRRANSSTSQNVSDTPLVAAGEKETVY